MSKTKAGKPVSRSTQFQPKRTEAFYDIRKLTCFADIKAQLIEGWPINQIVDFIQKEKKEMLDHTPGHLINVLYAFKNTIPKHEILQKRVPFFAKKLNNEVKKQVDVLDEFGKLLDLQLKRIARAADQEDTIGLNIGHLDQSIKTAHTILSSIHDVQSDLGITPRNLGSMDIQASVLQGVIHKFSNDSLSKVLESPVSRHKVLTVAERILALAADTNSSNLLSNLLSNVNAVTIDSDSIEKSENRVIEHDSIRQ